MQIYRHTDIQLPCDDKASDSALKMIRKGADEEVGRKQLISSPQSLKSR